MKAIARVFIFLMLPCYLVAEDQLCWYQGIDIGVEWLYWEVEQSQMDVAVSSTVDATTRNSKNIRPDFDYTNGYRVFAEYALNPCWNLGAAITHINSKPTVSVSLDPTQLATQFITLNDTLYPVYSAIVAGGINLSSLSAKWDLDFYYFDLDVSREFCVGHKFILEPYMGFKGLWMQQKFLTDGASPSIGVTINAKQRAKYYGIGLQGGISGNYVVGYGFSLIGKLGGAMMYSKTKLNIDANFVIPGNNLLILASDFDYRVFPTLDSFIGAQYVFCFYNALINLRVGWENHLFFHTNQFTSPADGNLTTQGLTLGGEIRF